MRLDHEASRSIGLRINLYRLGFFSLCRYTDMQQIFFLFPRVTDANCAELTTDTVPTTPIEATE